MSLYTFCNNFTSNITHYSILLHNKCCQNDKTRQNYISCYFVNSQKEIKRNIKYMLISVSFSCHCYKREVIDYICGEWRICWDSKIVQIQLVFY